MIAFLILCIFLGILLAPIALVIVRRANNKKLARMREIKDTIRRERYYSGVSGRGHNSIMEDLSDLIAEAEDLELEIAKSNDINSKREASRLLSAIRSN